jgi:hypothetical protein
MGGGEHGETRAVSEREQFEPWARGAGSDPRPPYSLPVAAQLLPSRRRLFRDTVAATAVAACSRRSSASLGVRAEGGVWEGGDRAIERTVDSSPPCALIGSRRRRLSLTPSRPRSLPGPSPHTSTSC